jgi:hypothetical protein
MTLHIVVQIVYVAATLIMAGSSLKLQFETAEETLKGHATVSDLTQYPHQALGRFTMSTQRIVALFVMTAGFAWLAGDFVQPDKPFAAHILITLLHALPIALTLLFAVPLVQRRDGGPRWAARGIGVVAAFYTIALVGILAYSVATPDPNAFGIHSLGDAEAAAVTAVGNLLWLASLRPSQARATLRSRRQEA